MLVLYVNTLLYKHYCTKYIRIQNPIVKLTFTLTFRVVKLRAGQLHSKNHVIEKEDEA
jgi:hypothetical protein